MSVICLYLSTERYDPVSLAIRMRTECDYSHVGFMHRPDKMTFSAKCDGHGVGWRTLKPEEKVLLLDAPRCDEALAKALTQEGRPYDKLDIAGIALGQDWHSAGHWICDALVFWAFEQVGMPLVNPNFIPRIHMTPRDVLLSPYVSEVL